MEGYVSGWLLDLLNTPSLLRIPTVQLVPTVILSRSFEQLGQQLFFICEKDQSQVNEKNYLKSVYFQVSGPR